MNPCEGIHFAELCDQFQKIEDMSSAGSKETKNVKFTTIFTGNLLKRMCGHSLYPILRLVLPTADEQERGTYNLRQMKIADAYIKALPLGDRSEEAGALKSKPVSQYDPGATLSLNKGNFGSTLEQILSKRVSIHKSDWTVGMVNTFLDTLVKSDDKISLIRDEVFTKLSPTEQKWIIRIILKDIGTYLGFKETYIFSNLWENARKRYESTNSLLVVCNELCEWQNNGGNSIASVVDNINNSDQSKITLFDKFSPMLAKGLNNAGSEMFALAVQAMKDHAFSAEHKLDGERMLMHRSLKDPHTNERTVRLFTRNNNEYTDKYKQIVEYGKNCIRCDDLACVLDGEILSWDDENEIVMPFGGNRTVSNIVKNYADDAKSWLKYVVFDIVFLQGPSAINIIQKHIENRDRNINPEVSAAIIDGDICHLPLAIRKEILKDVFIVEEKRHDLVPSIVCKSGSSPKRQIDLEAYFINTVNNGEEGLVVKSLSSTYRLGRSTRIRGDDWVKLKPDYCDTGLYNEIDVLILGRYLGKGRNGHGFGFLCGLLHTRGNKKFLTAGKVGSGLNYEEREELITKLQPYEKKWDTANPKYYPEHFVEWKSTKDDRPDYWYPPEHSIVLQLKCNELVWTTNYTAEYTWRFPRIERLRMDKGYDDVMTGHEFKELMTAPRVVPRNYHKGSSNVVSSSIDKKRKAGRSSSSSSSSSSPAKRINVLGVMKSSDKDEVMGSLFDAHTFAVFDSDYSQFVDPSQRSDPSHKNNKCDVINMIKKYGGNVVGTITSASVESKTLCILGNQPIQGYCAKIRNEMRSDRLDFVHYQYLISCIETNHVIDLSQHTHFYIFPCTKTKSMLQLDGFGFKTDIIYDESTLNELYKSIDPMFQTAKARKGTKATNSSTSWKDSIYDASILQDIEKLIDKNWREIFDNLPVDIKNQLGDTLFS